MSPPIVGPNVTVQRPSVSTPVQPRNKFPGDPTNPFTHTPQPDTGNSSGTASPGTRPGDTPPVRSTSRAANAYTPMSQPTPRPERERSTSNQPSRQQTPQTQERAMPVVTDAPTPVQNRRPQEQAEDPRITAFRQAAYAAPPPQNQPPPQQTSNPVPNQGENIRSSSPTVYAPQPYAPGSRLPQPPTSNPGPSTYQQRQPEMKQTGGFAKPFMPSPDIRPPSDDSLPRPFPSPYFGNDNAPSMPALAIPQQPSNTTYIPPQNEQPRRERDRSVSVPRTAPPPEPAAPIPMPASDARPTTLSRKKSVSFNPELDFSDAPTPVPRAHESSDAESPDHVRQRRHDRDRERDRDRPRRRHDRDYDAGDDFSDDTPFEDHRRRSSQSDRDKDRGQRQSSRRERSNTQSLDRESGRDRDRDRESKSNGNASSRKKERNRNGDRDVSPTGSDETVDLPERFDDRGRPKSGGEGKRSSEQDLIAESLDQILGGLFGGSSGKKGKR